MGARGIKANWQQLFSCVAHRLKQVSGVEIQTKSNNNKKTIHASRRNFFCWVHVAPTGPSSSWAKPEQQTHDADPQTFKDLSCNGVCLTTWCLLNTVHWTASSVWGWHFLNLQKVPTQLLLLLQTRRYIVTSVIPFSYLGRFQHLPLISCKFKGRTIFF